MRDLIKKWLGVNLDIAEALKKARTTDEVHLRYLIGEALEAVIANKSDSPWTPYFYSNNAGNTFTAALRRAALAPAGEAARLAVENRVNHEQFIDDIVARIQRKQLKVPK